MPSRRGAGGVSTKTSNSGPVAPAPLWRPTGTGARSARMGSVIGWPS